MQRFRLAIAGCCTGIEIVVDEVAAAAAAAAAADGWWCSDELPAAGQWEDAAAAAAAAARAGPMRGKRLRRVMLVLLRRGRWPGRGRHPVDPDVSVVHLALQQHRPHVAEKIRGVLVAPPAQRPPEPGAEGVYAVHAHLHARSNIWGLLVQGSGFKVQG